MAYLHHRSSGKAANKKLPGEFGGLSEQETMLLTRVGRYLRLLRLLRIFKAMEVIGERLEHITSESARILLGIAKLLAFIIIINQYFS